MTGKLLSISRAIRAEIKASRIVTDVLPFGKLFEAEDISQVSFGASAAFVSVLAAPSDDNMAAGSSRILLDIAVAIASKGTLDLMPYDASLDIAERIYLLVGWQQWGVTKTGPATKRRIEMMPVPMRKGVALHAVRWSQSTVLGEDYPDPMGVDESLRPVGPVDITLRGRGDE